MSRTPPGTRLLDSAQISALVERLCKLAAIPTDVLRSKAASSELLQLSPPEAALVLGSLLRLRRDRTAAAVATAAISRALARGEVDQERVEEIRACARSRADRLVEALLAAGPALREYDQNEELFVDRRLRRMTLGERRSLSRARDIDLLMRLAHDQDVRVIQGLLTNPRLTEREAVLIASRRPTHVHVLEAVLASRFGTLPRVRRAVAHNPYAPVALAARALATLSTPELRQIATDERIASNVRDQARALLVGRRGTPAELAQAGASPIETDAELQTLIESLAGDEPGEEDEIVALNGEGEPIGRR